MELYIIDTGYFFADGGAMFGTIPKTTWRHRYASDDDNRCKLALRTILFKTDTRTFLIDTGIGPIEYPFYKDYRFHDKTDLLERLAEINIRPEEVTDVIITHLHFDHCGYCTHKNAASGKTKVTFPNATHWISQKQWDNFLSPSPLEKDSFLFLPTRKLYTEGKIQFVTVPQVLSPEVSVKIMDGHTPGQLVPYLIYNDETFVFAGDVIPLAASVSPAWISAYDLCPAISYQEKTGLLEEASVSAQNIIYCHDGYTAFSKVRKLNDFFITYEKKRTF